MSLEMEEIIDASFWTTEYVSESRNMMPTHTEDGIPIRKLYVSNLPYKTTRTELFGIFAQYGFIKSCWLKLNNSNTTGHQLPSPLYAFITFSKAEDAHKAMQAPKHEQVLRGHTLNISPADSWHQPIEDSEGRVHWKSRRHHNPSPCTINSSINQAVSICEPSTSSQSETNVVNVDSCEELKGHDILDVLNRDCMMIIFSYVPLIDLIRSEIIGKRWQNAVQDYMKDIHLYKTAWWEHNTVTLTTAVLRCILQRIGPSLRLLHIDHHWSALNDRIAHTIGKFCPQLEELKVIGMHTKNWNPIIYGCKQLKSVSFVSCTNLTDKNLLPLVANDSSIERLFVKNNNIITGSFLTNLPGGSRTTKLTHLSLYNCICLQATVLSSALKTLTHLKTLELNSRPSDLWIAAPQILMMLPNLEHLTLKDFSDCGHCNDDIDNFSTALATLTELKTLNISNNKLITNAVLKQIAKHCKKLTSLNVSGCNGIKFPKTQGVSDEGIKYICKTCTELRHLDVSCLDDLTDAGLANVHLCTQLRSIRVRQNASVTPELFISCINACPYLEKIDLCGSLLITSHIISETQQYLENNPRKITLCLNSTPATSEMTLNCVCTVFGGLTIDLVDTRSMDYLLANHDIGYDEDLDWGDVDYDIYFGEIDGYNSETSYFSEYDLEDLWYL